MRKILSLSLILSAAALAGCTHGKTDEFAVARSAPLIVPPDFSLAPPVTGTGGLSPNDAQQQAIDALFGGPAPRSGAETSLLNAAGRSSAEMGIRSTVWDPDTRIVDKGAVTLQILSAAPANSSVASASAGQ